MSGRAWRTCFGSLLPFFVALAIAACESGQPRPAPALPAPSASVSTTPTSTLALSVVTVLTASQTSSSTARLIARDTLNIRSGPGVNYAMIGAFAQGAEARITGRSEDGLWWQVACPSGTAGDMCWVIAEPLFGEALDAVAVPVALAPPTPTITPTPSPTPCVPTAPVGWAAYQVQPGDTLFALSMRTGATVEELAGINCLETDLLTVHSVLFLPTAAYTPDPNAPLPTRTVLAVGGLTFGRGGAASGSVSANVGVGPGGGSGSGGGPAPEISPQLGTRVALGTVEEGILSVLAFSQPAGGACPTGNMPRIQVEPLDGRSELEIVRPFRVCPLGFNAPGQVVISITADVPPEFVSWYGGDEVRGWYWSLQPGARGRFYTVTAQLGDVIAPAQPITITEATSPTVVVLSREITATQRVRVAVAGMPPGAPLYLYQYVIAERRCKIFGRVALPDLDPPGEGLIEFPLLADDPVAEYYCVGTGLNAGNASTRVIGPNDYKVFHRLVE